MYNVFGLTGTHSTGKTTLVEAIQKDSDLQHFNFYTSFTRKSGTALARELNEVTDESQSKLLEKLERYNETFDFTQPVLFDRTLIDTVAYTDVLHQYGHVSIETVMQAYKLLEKYAPVYKTIFYLPIEFDVVDDGERSIDESFRRDVDEAISNIIKKSALNVVNLTGTVEERCKLLKQTLLK